MTTSFFSSASYAIDLGGILDNVKIVKSVVNEVIPNDKPEAPKPKAKKKIKKVKKQTVQAESKANNG